MKNPIFNFSCFVMLICASRTVRLGAGNSGFWIFLASLESLLTTLASELEIESVGFWPSHLGKERRRFPGD